MKKYILGALTGAGIVIVAFLVFSWVESLRYSDRTAKQAAQQEESASNNNAPHKTSQAVSQHVATDAAEAATEEPQEEAESPPENIVMIDLELKRGDTFSSLLNEAGVGSADTFEIAEKLNEVYDLRSVRAGERFELLMQELQAEETNEVISESAPEAAEETEENSESDNNEDTTENNANEAADEDATPTTELMFHALRIDRSEYIIEVKKDAEGAITVERQEKILTKHIKQAAGTIEYSLDQLGNALGIPPNIMIEAIKAYSFDVDFQRDIRQGAAFKVLYEVFYNDAGEKVKDGALLYAMLHVHGEDKELFNYTDKNGDEDYFNRDGRTAKKALLKTPINGARISSGFGMRRHPILGYTKMHKGMDFAARSGTPIFAAGNGTVSFIGRKGGYGNYIKLRHNSEYSTAYAHMRGFAKGMSKGRRVKQGQVIGYVGSTGRSTGPHLHYEIHFRGKQVNPAKVKIPPGRKLPKEEMAQFEAHITSLESLMDATPVTLSISP